MRAHVRVLSPSGYSRAGDEDGHLADPNSNKACGHEFAYGTYCTAVQSLDGLPAHDLVIGD